MLSFFRRMLKSWVVVIVLVLIAGAVVVSGVDMTGGLGGAAGGADGETLASMDGGRIGTIEADRRVRDEYQRALQQQPGLTMAAFVQGGGVDATLRRLVSAKAVELWGRDHGFTASKRLVDGEIASIPAFQGPTGSFDEATFRRLIATQRIPEQQLRADIAGDLIRRQVLGPIAGGSRATDAMVTPYAAMLLDRREGTIGLVPAAAMPQGAPPTDAQIQAYYAANIARFTLPERRVLRYATIGAAQVGTAAAPTEAEIAAAYKANAAQYAARETRTVSQVLLPTEPAARALVAKVRAGTSFAAAAQAAGFSPTDTALGAKSQTELAGLASPAVATAAFAAAQGAVTDPQKSPLGWHIVHVDRIASTPATPLSAVRATLVADLAKRKTETALADRVAKIEDMIADGATFEQAAASLPAVTTPPLLPSGIAPSAPAFAPSPILQPLLKAAFQAGEDDDPNVETLGPGSYALLDIVDVVPAAPVPLAQVRAEVVRALINGRAMDRARQVADAIVAKAQRGTPLAVAFSTAGMKLPAPQSGGGRQIDLAQMKQQGGVPPALQLLFTMAPGKVRTLPAPDGSGWFVVQLDTVKKGDIRQQPQLVAATRDEYGRALGNEYADAFIAGIMKDVDVKQDAAAIARFKASLLQGSAAQ